MSMIVTNLHPTGTDGQSIGVEGFELWPITNDLQLVRCFVVIFETESSGAKGSSDRKILS